MSSLFPGLPFQSSVFPPLIDMSSTQALVALVSVFIIPTVQLILTTTFPNRPAPPKSPESTISSSRKTAVSRNLRLVRGAPRPRWEPPRWPVTSRHLSRHGTCLGYCRTTCRPATRRPFNRRRRRRPSPRSHRSSHPPGPPRASRHSRWI